MHDSLRSGDRDSKFGRGAWHEEPRQKTSATLPARYPARTVWASSCLESLVFPLVWTVPRRTEPYRKILIVEPFRLGDAALLAGMLGPLRHRYPAAEIHLLLSPFAAPLYQGHPAVARVHQCAFPWTDLPPPRASWAQALRFLWRLRELRFDLGIDPRGDVRSQFALVMAGCCERVGLAQYLSSNIQLRGRLLTRKVRCDRLAHRTQMHSAILTALGAEPIADPPPPSRRGVQREVRAVLSVGAGWAYRRWPADRWAVLAAKLRELGVDVRLLGGQADAETLRSVTSSAGSTAAVCTTSLTGFLEELREADVVVSADSAAVHIASEWFGIPVVALFGPGVVSLYRPRSAGSVVLHHQERFPCAPCLQKKCVRPGDSCMPTITVDEVVRAVVQVLARLDKLQQPRRPVDGIADQEA